MPSSALRELLKCWLPGGDEISERPLAVGFVHVRRGVRIAARMQEGGREGREYMLFFVFCHLAPSVRSFGCLWFFFFFCFVNVTVERCCETGGS